MKTPPDPPRWIDSADADPVLQNALRVIRGAPSAAAIGKIADGAERAAREAVAGKGASSASMSLAMKLVVATLAGSALVYLASPAIKQTRIAPLSQATHEEAVRPEPSSVAGTSPQLTSRPGAPGAAPPDALPRVAVGAGPAPMMAPLAVEPRRPEPTSDDQHARLPSSPGASVAGQGTPAARGVEAKREQGARGTRSHPSPDARATHEEPRPAPEHTASEMDLLEDAQQALTRDPKHALELLAQHRAGYPRSKFAQERDVLRLEAFQRLHDAAGLRTGARAFLERYPHSPHRARVDRLLEGLGAR